VRNVEMDFLPELYTEIIAALKQYLQLEEVR
jgi:hypothetical protein